MQAFLAGISLGADYGRDGAHWLIKTLLLATCGVCAVAAAALSAAASQPYFPPPT